MNKLCFLNEDFTKHHYAIFIVSLDNLYVGTIIVTLTYNIIQGSVARYKKLKGCILVIIGRET